MGKKETSDEVERIIDRGLKGIKLHPDFQKFNIDDESAFSIYEICEGRLPILFHVGDDRYDTSSPTRLLNVLNKFPNLTAIAAHLGGYQRWDEAMETIIGHPNVYIDTCSSLRILTIEKAVKIIRTHGYERVLFGVDYPMFDHAEEKDLVDKLELNETELVAIYANNIKKLLYL
jgi:predicted TIM-barrel fold metal-dependent hydrolase